MSSINVIESSSEQGDKLNGSVVEEISSQETDEFTISYQILKDLKQTIANLTERQKEYRVEIDKLEKQLADASQKIKEIAVAALQKDTTSRSEQNIPKSA